MEFLNDRWIKVLDKRVKVGLLFINYLCIMFVCSIVCDVGNVVVMGLMWKCWVFNVVVGCFLFFSLSVLCFMVFESKFGCGSFFVVVLIRRVRMSIRYGILWGYGIFVIVI